jgi:hypothetical protein
VLDIAVAIALIRLLGFHWALMPTLAAEAVPALDLAPTWTASVLLITGFSPKRWLIVAGWIAVALVIFLLVWHFHHHA